MGPILEDGFSAHVDDLVKDGLLYQTRMDIVQRSKTTTSYSSPWAESIVEAVTLAGSNNVWQFLCALYGVMTASELSSEWCLRVWMANLVNASVLGFTTERVVFVSRISPGGTCVIRTRWADLSARTCWGNASHARTAAYTGMARRVELGVPILTLRLQCRMHPDISSLVSRLFYEILWEDAFNVLGRPFDPAKARWHDWEKEQRKTHLQELIRAKCRKLRASISQSGPIFTGSGPWRRTTH